MHPVGLYLLGQVHPVVDDKQSLVLPAQGLYLCCRGQHLGIGGAFHAQLHPPAAPLEGHSRPVNIAEAVGGVGYKLYLSHTVSIFNGLKKWFTGPCPCPMPTPAPAASAAVT